VRSFGCAVLAEIRTGLASSSLNTVVRLLEDSPATDNPLATCVGDPSGERCREMERPLRTDLRFWTYRVRSRAHFPRNVKRLPPPCKFLVLHRFTLTDRLSRSLKHPLASRMKWTHPA